MDIERWSSLQLRHLLALEAVAREGTFARAAEVLGYSQSAVSHQIATLENLTGVRLLNRPPGRPPSGLTDAGRVLLNHADTVIARTRATAAKLNAMSAETLRVGAYPSIAARILPELLAASALDVHVAVEVSGYESELFEKLERGDLDVIFCSVPPPTGPFGATYLFKDPYVLLVPRDSKLVSLDGALGLHDLAGLPLMTYRHWRYPSLMDAQLRAAHPSPTYVLRCDDYTTLEASVRAGIGVALMPRSALACDTDGTVAVPFREDLAARTIGVAHRNDQHLGPPAERLVSVASHRYG